MNAGANVIERVAAPLFDLLLRLFLAGPFFASGVLKAADWDKALYLATHEYPVSWLAPSSAAVLGVIVELAGSVLLAFGLATRVAAAALLALSIVIQTSYIPQDTTLFVIALLAGYVIRGANALSIDRLVAAGLASSTVPFAAIGARVATELTRFGAPLYQLVFRGWLAWWTLAHLGLHPIAATAFAALLAPGVGTRVVSVLLLVVVAATMTEESVAPYFAWSLGWLAVFGAGAISFDGWLARRAARNQALAFTEEQRLPRVVVVGAGFAGLTVALELRRLPVSVTLIDRHNYHLFQPLLYQVATAGLSVGDIAVPVRGLFRDSPNTCVLLGEVIGVDTVGKCAQLADRRVPYDYLVLATGAVPSYFGQTTWQSHAPSLKNVDDALEVRRRLLTAFEHAEVTDDDGERQAWLTFLVVGGGPTGVELAGAIAELARLGMQKEFRRFDPASARIVLVQSGPRILPTFPEHLSRKATRSLEALGVDVRIESRVQAIDSDGATINGVHLPARTVLWAAGVAASSAATWLNAGADRAGRLRVGPDLTVPGLPDVFAVGDTAHCIAWRGQPVPGLAPAAKQAGAYAARVIGARVQGRQPPPPFRYVHLGSLATIGRKSAVADFGFAELTGAIAWWLWGVVHVGFLVGVRSRVSVALDWFWSYLTYRSGTRLITGAQPVRKGSDPLRTTTPPARLEASAAMPTS